MTSQVSVWAGAALFALAAGSFMPALAAGDDAAIARGKYLVQTSGCNDCHTPGYLLSEGKVPVDKWLTGDSFGWRGPWGTTYAANLRLFMAALSEDEWVKEAKELRRRPPMPWFSLNIMEDGDLRAIYRFTRSLGAPGEPAPDYVPPDEEPKPPYALFPSPPANN